MCIALCLLQIKKKNQVKGEGTLCLVCNKTGMPLIESINQMCPVFFTCNFDTYKDDDDDY